MNRIGLSKGEKQNLVIRAHAAVRINYSKNNSKKILSRQKKVRKEKGFKVYSINTLTEGFCVAVGYYRSLILLRFCSRKTYLLWRHDPRQTIKK